jgi:hypothetical protein
MNMEMEVLDRCSLYAGLEWRWMDCLSEGPQNAAPQVLRFDLLASNCCTEEKNLLCRFRAEVDEFS